MRRPRGLGRRALVNSSSSALVWRRARDLHFHVSAVGAAFLVHRAKRRRPKRKPRTYADLLHPWQRLLRDQIDTVVSPEPPAAPNPDALLDSLLDMAEQGEGDGLSYF